MPQPRRPTHAGQRSAPFSCCKVLGWLKGAGHTRATDSGNVPQSTGVPQAPARAMQCTLAIYHHPYVRACAGGCSLRFQSGQAASHGATLFNYDGVRMATVRVFEH